MSACDDCLRRTDLIAAMAGRLQVEFKQRSAPGRVLALPDDDLLEIADGAARARYHRFDASAARERAAAARLTTVCRCRDAYPTRLRDLADPPAVIHVLGDLSPTTTTRSRSWAPAARRRMGSRSPRRWAAGSRPRACRWSPGSRSGSTRPPTKGALQAPGTTIAVLAASADVAYPARGWRLHAAVAKRGAVISEMPPGAEAHRWCFVARNRIIAALSAATVVVQATERSGSLTTADFAAELGRAVGAVPGLVTSRLCSAGTHGLIQAGAPLIRDARDALDLLAEATGPRVRDPAASRRVALTPPLRQLLAAVEDGVLAEYTATPEQARAALAGLAELERLGLVRRGFTGALGTEGQRMTQVSLAPPFWEELTTSAPSERATRVSPPGSTRGVAPSPRNTNGRRSM